MDLIGRSGIVTGDSSRIGSTVINTLAETGIAVYAVNRTGQPKDAEGSHEGVIHVAADVSNYGEMESLIEKIGENKGIDSLINNTGITVKRRVENFDDSDFERIMKIDVSSIFKLSRLCHPYLKKSVGRGGIMNTTSMAAHLGFSEVVPCCTSKGAVLSITRGLAMEQSDDNIDVNSITPGWLPSRMSQQVMDAECKARILSRIPMYRFEGTRDIVKTAKYLVSDSAGYIIGQSSAVDGRALAFGF